MIIRYHSGRLGAGYVVGVYVYSLNVYVNYVTLVCGRRHVEQKGRSQGLTNPIPVLSYWMMLMSLMPTDTSQQARYIAG